MEAALAEVSFGEWLKRRRSALGLTQEQLARQIHCSTSALRKFESEQRRPSAEVVEQLAEVFKIPPAERTSFRRFARGDWQAFGSAETEDAPWRGSNIQHPSNLPSLITSFIGREKEQFEVIHLLKKNRLVTLAGAGGMGKTRLAIQLGNQLLQDYPHGVWFIPLDSLSDPLLVPQTVASSCGVCEDAGRPIIEILKHVLRQKTSLLLLDNCEHLLESCRQLIITLLTHCPNLRILATSRELLNVEGEATYYLPPLSTPEVSVPPEKLSAYESIRLFTERAGLALSTFRLTRENAPAIMEICRRVEGIPLAIELTAARVNLLSVEEISKQLHKSFAFLASGRRTALSRHQTLQASLDWSWSLLSDSEQVFLRRLSVFAGGWTLEAARAVCDGDALNLIDALVQKSLIQVEQNPEHETRYSFHEMVRQYTREKLLEAGDSETTRDRHLAYFVTLVEQAEPELYRSHQVLWFKKLDDEIDNLRLALEWSLATDVESGLRIASVPWRFWQRRNYQELRDWTSQLLERYSKSNSLRAQALAVYSTYMFACGNPIGTRQAAEQGLQLARLLSDRNSEALNLLFLGRSVALSGNYNEGFPSLEQSLAIYRTLGDKIGQAMATGWLGMNHNDLERSRSLLSKSLKLHRELGNLSGIAWCLAFLAYHAIFGGDFSALAPWLDEAITLYRQLGDQPNEADTLQVHGMLAYWQGNYQRACDYFEQSIALYEKSGGLRISWPRVRMGHTFVRQGAFAQAREAFEICLQQFQEFIGVVYTIEGLAALQLNQGQPERAARLFAWANARREELVNHRPPIEQADVDKDIKTCIGQMGKRAFSAACKEGSKMTTEEAMGYALSENA
jgi:predicted ATPase/DNA-binding XRE family transcriptional regulator